MKLNLTLRRPDGSGVDVTATFDAAATVGDLAEALLVRDPQRSTGVWKSLDAGPTIAVVDREGPRAVDTSLPVGSSGVQSGAVITLTQVPKAVRQGKATAAATVRVTAGPDAGLSVPLGRGTWLVGRSAAAHVRLTDPQVSREHATLIVADSVELVDLGSANGILVGGGLVPRCTLRGRDHVQLGDTVLSVDVVGAAVGDSPAPVVAFNRSPQVDSAYGGDHLKAPQPPERLETQRFPMLPLLAPVLVGALLYALTRSMTSLVFVALSPVLMLANILESRWGSNRSYRTALAEFRADVADLVGQATTARETERAQRGEEQPATSAWLAAGCERSTRLWSRRPGGDGFLSLRLGSGRLPSRSTIELPTSPDCAREVWQELEQAVEPFATVDGVPVVADLPRCGALGVAGERGPALEVARALMVQVAAMHSPAEVTIAGFASPTTAPDWDWLKWLPHTDSPHSPLGCRSLAASPVGAVSLASELDGLIARRLSDKSDPRIPAVIVVVEDDTPVERARIVDIASRGGAVGVHVLWVADRRAQLPAGCGMFLDLGTSEPTVGQVDAKLTVAPVAQERLTADDALAFARALAPLIDSGALVHDDTSLSRSVSWLTLHGRELAAAPDAVLERWVESRSVLTGPYTSLPSRRRRGSLRAIVGQSATGPHVLDLRSQGPHALVGGTTGSGKSELLQSWILGVAAAHSPQRVTFLLVDYKGGSAFADCVRLPHTVGLVTDLSPHLVRRALTSLSAELRYRERLLSAKKAKDLLELETMGDPDTPPSLIIVVDEFAALVHEVPEFVDGVVDVSQRGRSLGLHLVLATQRPAGVIKDNLRANTNLRLALRVADEADSTDVIGSPDAALFDPALPGRAVSKTGPGRLVPFQAAYAGGWTTDTPPRPEVTVEDLVFGASSEWVPPSTDVPVTAGDLGPNDIKRVVTTIERANRLAKIPEPRRPWLPELAPVYDLAKLPASRRDTELVFAVRDDPEHQAQPTVSFDPDRDGNLAVFGTGGVGKSALLRSLAVAAGFTVRGGPCQVYGIDCGSRGLAMLEQLPHVGSIVTGNDQERITRLLGELRERVDERAARYAAVNAGSITDYRRLADAPDEPRILLLVDGIGAFRSAYELGDNAAWFETFLSIASEGRPVGIHVLLSADRAGAMPSTLASAVQRRVVLRMAEDNDYALMGLPTDVLTVTSPPGRGLIDGAEIQVAVLGGSRDTLQQAQAIAALAESMLRAGVATAPEVRRLPESVPLSSLPAAVGERPTIGLSGVTLDPVGIDPQGTFVIAGPAGSGRTTALHAVVSAVQRVDPSRRCYLLGKSGTSWSDVEWAAAAYGPADIVTLAGDLSAELAADSAPGEVVIAIEDLPDLLNSPAEMAVEALLRTATATGQFVATEGDVKEMSSGMSLIAAAKVSRSGIALAPEQFDGTMLFGTDFPRVRRGDFPPGRGLLVQKGRATLVQVGIAPPPVELPPAGAGRSAAKVPRARTSASAHRTKAERK